MYDNHLLAMASIIETIFYYFQEDENGEGSQDPMEDEDKDNMGEIPQLVYRPISHTTEKAISPNISLAQLDPLLRRSRGTLRKSVSDVGQRSNYELVPYKPVEVGRSWPDIGDKVSQTNQVSVDASGFRRSSSVGGIVSGRK